MTPAGNWPAGHEYGASSHNDEDHENGRVAIIRSPFLQRDESEGMYAPWRLFEERVRTGPYGLLRFPSQPHSPVRILILDDEIAEAVNPGLRRFIQNSPPRIRGDWHLRLETPEPEELGLNREEFKKAMKTMTKQVYKPTHQPRRGRKRGIFSTRNNSSYNTSNSPDEKEKNEGKQCAICLEAFVSNESVLVTPCSHMFHNDCLAPWVKSHGQCPICRFAFSERRRETAVTQPNNSYDTTTTSIADDQLANDLIFLIRAMEEAFNWINHSP